MNDMSFSSSLISQLRDRRYSVGVPQTILDDKIGVAPGLVAKWETGNRKPTAFNLYCWAKALDCKLTLEVEQ
jgi:transcriptional regulator with XRE-family HTH domain